MSRFRFCCFNSIGAALFLAILSSSANSQDVVVPNAFTSAEGPLGNGIPFSRGDLFCNNGIRYQQVYAGSDLPGSGIINAVRFRLDGDYTAPFPATTYGGVTIELSRSENSPASLSTTFADNVGADVVEVFSGDLTLAAPGGGDAPKPFDVEIPLQTTFSYGGGDLLLDLVIEVCNDLTVFFDSDNSSIITRRVVAYDRTDPDGTDASGPGLVTQFRFNAPAARPVPVFGSYGFAGPLLLVSLMLSIGIVFLRYSAR